MNTNSDSDTTVEDIPFEFSINKDRFKFVLNDLERLRQELKIQTCPICLEDLIGRGEDNGNGGGVRNGCGSSTVTISPCHDLHAFHKQCIVESLQHDNRCPCCRLFISKEFLEDYEL
mmetsp:Transcript_48328/g.105320  ORF Transcript_48328/g.105320 Transcript_48328/m.105320 type:complete len:117 (+) Transcript_48328:737-1087(+)